MTCRNLTKAKSFDLGQPARIAQADLGRYFLLMHLSHWTCRDFTKDNKVLPRSACAEFADWLGTIVFADKISAGFKGLASSELRINPAKNPCKFGIIVLDVNSLSNSKILDWSKVRACKDNKINVSENLRFDLGRVENIVEKGENAGYQHFLLFLQCFQKVSCTGSLKLVTVL